MFCQIQPRLSISEAKYVHCIISVKTLGNSTFLFQDGATLLHSAAHRGNIKVVKLLLENTKVDPGEQNQVKSVVIESHEET